MRRWPPPFRATAAFLVSLEPDRPERKYLAEKPGSVRCYFVRHPRGIRCLMGRTRWRRGLRHQHLPLHDGNRDLECNRVDHESRRPDTGCDLPFHKARTILDHLMQSAGNEAWDDQSHSFLDPNAGKSRDASQYQASSMPDDFRLQEQRNSEQVQTNRRPDPRDECVVTM
jgi:hypothetical protein